MKKSLLALAALTAFAGAASAQSSVTLFGIVDLEARSVKNGDAGTVKSLSTDGNASSRLGFRGVEDLGGGLRAGFWLEAGVSADNGTVGGGNGGATANAAPAGAVGGAAPSGSGGAFFNRRSTVSLMGNFGEVRLGRDYVPTFWNHTVFDVFGTQGVGSNNNLMTIAPSTAVFPGGAQNFVRANNTIGYFLPSMGGLYGQVMAAAGENQVPQNKYIGGRVGYGAGPFNVAVAVGKVYRDPAAGAMTGDVDIWNVGGSFNFGFATIYGQYSKYEEGPVKELQNFNIGVAVTLGQGTIKASYGKTDNKLTAALEPSADQVAIGYVWDLSKRTAVYAHASKLKNDTGLAYTVGVGGNTPPVTGFTSTGYEFGVRHSF